MNAKHPRPTSEEIDRRLRIVSELRNLCLSLGRARRIAPADQIERKASAATSAVRDICSDVCAVEIKPASNCDGAK
jgi:hypothetical protein